MDYWQVGKSNFTTEYAVCRGLLRELRIHKGLTQVKLAEALDLPQSFVSKSKLVNAGLTWLKFWRSAKH